MTKRDIAVFLFKWKYSLIGYLVFIVAAVTAFVYLMPQKYDATAAVLIESNRGPVMRALPTLGIEQLSVLNSEVSIILSRTVLSAAVDKVGLGEGKEPTIVQLWKKRFFQLMEELDLREPRTPRESMIEALEGDLVVSPLPASNVITLELRGDNPQRVAALVNAVTDAYIAHHLKVFSSPGTADVMREGLDRIGQDLNAKRAELQRYKQKTAAYALSDTRQALATLQSQLTIEINKARNELAEASAQFGANHTKVALAKGKLDNLERESRQTVQRLRTLEAQEGRVKEMEVGIASMEKAAQEFQTRYQEQRLENLSNPDVVNVRVIDYAEVPTRPAHSRLFYIALAVAGGALLSLGIALVKEYFDHRVTDPDVVQQLLCVPTLGSLERA